MAETVQEQLRRLRDLIALAEAPKEPPKPWSVSRSSIFDESLAHHSRKFKDLPDKLAKFLQVKSDNPLQNRYGKHDGPFTGPPLLGFNHCHLRDDAVLIYHLANRCINLIVIVNHAEIEGKRMRQTANTIAPFKK